MPIPQEAREMVTDHVIVRWLERVEGYNFDDIREHLRKNRVKVTDTSLLSHLASKYGLYRGHVIFRIATKQVRNAIALGARRINRGDQTLMITNGVVTTIVPRTSAKVKAERGFRRKQQRGEV